MAYEWPAGVQNCSGQLNAACLRPIRQILTPMPAKGVQMAQNCSQSVCLSCLVVKKNAENKALFETRECLGQLVGKQNMWNEREKIRECSQHEDLDSDTDLIYVASPRDESFK